MGLHGAELNNLLGQKGRAVYKEMVITEHAMPRIQVRVNAVGGKTCQRDYSGRYGDARHSPTGISGLKACTRSFSAYGPDK